jgi:sec-independent protein translocase protein TatB
MLDIGWPELIIVALVTIIVVGPKELPRVLRTVTQIVRKVRAMANEFQSGIDDLAREAELDDLKRDIEKTASTDLAGELENQIDPTGEVTKSMREIEESLKEEPREKSDTGKSSEVEEGPSEPPATAIAQTGARNGDDGVAAPAKRKKKAGGSA